MEPTRDPNSIYKAATPPAGGVAGSPSPHAGPRDQPHSASAGPIAFAQLLNAVQQCGLGLNTEVIVSVRDCEYGSGRYQQAIDLLGGLCRQLDAQASRRQSQLLQEEIRYKAGGLKMTPREWQMRQRRVIEQTQKIEAARRLFARVMDGLNVLRAAQRVANVSRRGQPLRPYTPTENRDRLAGSRAKSAKRGLTAIYIVI